MRTNFEMQNQNITMVRGDTLAFNCEVFDEDGNPITVDSAYFTCKKDISLSEMTFQKSLGHGISQEDNIITVRVAPADTKEVDEGNYFYDFQIGVGNDIFTIMIGMLTLMQDVT
jgi:hypothetical protein